MAILIVLLRITLVLVCLLLVGVILLQRNKGGGAGVSFGGGAEAVFGAQMGDVLTKSTVILGIIFLANTLALSLLQARGTAGSGGGWLEAEAKAQQQRMAAAAQAEAAAIPLDDFADSDTAAALDDIVRADTAAETEADVSLDATAALPDTPPIATESAAPAATVEPEAAAE